MGADCFHRILRREGGSRGVVRAREVAALATSIRREDGSVLDRPWPRVRTASVDGVTGQHCLYSKHGSVMIQKKRGWGMWGAEGAKSERKS